MLNAAPVHFPCVWRRWKCISSTNLSIKNFCKKRGASLMNRSLLAEARWTATQTVFAKHLVRHSSANTRRWGDSSRYWSTFCFENKQQAEPLFVSLEQMLGALCSMQPCVLKNSRARSCIYITVNLKKSISCHWIASFFCMISSLNRISAVESDTCQIIVKKRFVTPRVAADWSARVSQ